MATDPQALQVPSDKSEGIYLYGFALTARLAALKPNSITGPIGLDGGPVSQMPYNDIAALASRVPIGDFSGPVAEANLKDLAWVGPRACRHQEVVEAIMQCSPVLPARFGTLFSSSQPLLELCHRHYDIISGFLKEADHKAEWGLKGFLDRSQARKSLNPDPNRKREATPPSPGKAYFLQKKRAAEMEQALNRELKQIFNAIWKDLQQYAARFCERKTLSRASTGLEMDMVLNWAFLLDTDQQDRFAAALEQARTAHSRHGLRFELSGPWPPYSFAPNLETP